MWRAYSRRNRLIGASGTEAFGGGSIEQQILVERVGQIEFGVNPLIRFGSVSGGDGIRIYTSWPCGRDIHRQPVQRSRRSLECVFQSVIGIGPVNYIRVLQLNLVCR
jgi:hypothetical protein